MTARVHIGCDPGNCTGIAIGVDRKLVMAYAATPDDRLRWPPVTIDLAGAEWARMTIEIPDRLDKGVRLSNIITLATTAGRWIERAKVCGASVNRVTPGAWKGQVPKAAFGRRILARLTTDERAIIDALGLPASKLHNVVDGVGLFLWSVGRLERRYGNG